MTYFTISFLSFFCLTEKNTNNEFTIWFFCFFQVFTSCSIVLLTYPTTPRTRPWASWRPATHSPSNPWFRKVRTKFGRISDIFMRIIFFVNLAYGVVHKWRHAILDNFYPPSARVFLLRPLYCRHKILDPLRPWRHLCTTPMYYKFYQNVQHHIVVVVQATLFCPPKC